MGKQVSQNSKTFFLFDMTTGKKKLAYGDDVDDAYAILEMRLTKEEMDLIIKDKFTKIPQKDLQKVVSMLG
jgi:hypothetical protein